jgi:hypothetical protein
MDTNLELTVPILLYCHFSMKVVLAFASRVILDSETSGTHDSRSHATFQ